MTQARPARRPRLECTIPSEKLQDSFSYPPRLLRADRAAAYLDMGKSKFLELVSQGRLPRPVRIDGITSWDRLELDGTVED